MSALVAVIENGSFSAAARSLGKTPSALSRIIQHFELDLGVDLFERVEGQAPQPTSTARTLYRQAMEIVPRLQILENTAVDCRDGLESRLVLAIHSMAFNETLGQALRAFVEAYPSVELTLLDPDSFDLDQALIAGQVDLVFMPASIEQTRAVSFHRFSVMEYCYVVGEQHPLARHSAELSEADLLPHTQILPAISDVVSPEMQDGLRIVPRYISCQRLVQIMELLRIGIGFAYLPRHAVAMDLEAGRLRELKLESALAGLASWDVEVRWASLGPAGQWLLDFIRENL